MKYKLYLAAVVFVISAVGLANPPQSPTQQSTQSQGQGKKGDSGTGSDTSRQQTSPSSQPTKEDSARLNNSDRRFVKDAAEDGMAEVALGQLAVERAANDEVKQFAQRMIDDHSKAGQELMRLATAKGMAMPTGMMDHSARQPSDSRTSAHQTQSGQTGQSSSQAGSQSTTDPQTNRQAATRPSPQSGTQSGQQSSQMTGQQANLHGKHRDAMNRLSKLSGAEFDREYMRHQLKDHEKAITLFERQANNGNDAELKDFASRTLPTLREHQQMARSIASKVGASNAKAGRNSGNTAQSRQNQ